jgi:hypothetical protein
VPSLRGSFGTYFCFYLVDSITCFFKHIKLCCFNFKLNRISVEEVRRRLWLSPSRMFQFLCTAPGLNSSSSAPSDSLVLSAIRLV